MCEQEIYNELNTNNNKKGIIMDNEKFNMIKEHLKSIERMYECKNRSMGNSYKFNFNSLV